MIAIRDNELFSSVQKKGWAGLFEENRPKNNQIPAFCGGLDRMKKTKKSVFFYDRGCNGRSNSFVIRRELPV